jgi:hypothetical protein
MLEGDRSLAQPWAASLTEVTDGRDDDLWDESWSVADLDDASFDVALPARPLQDARVEAVRVSLHYCE